MEDYLTQTELIERGWTRKTINIFLGTPDKIGGSSYSRKKVSHLFDLSRILLAEKTPEFQQWKAKKDAKKATRINVRELLENCQKFYDFEPYKIPQGDRDSMKEIGGNPELAEQFINQMLKRSEWYNADTFIKVFKRPLPGGYKKFNQIPEGCFSRGHIYSLVESFESKGFYGIPFIAFIEGQRASCARNLLTGAHRLQALKIFCEKNKGSQMLIPVFDLISNEEWFDAQCPFTEAESKYINKNSDGSYHFWAKAISRFNGIGSYVTGMDW